MFCLLSHRSCRPNGFRASGRALLALTRLSHGAERRPRCPWGKAGRHRRYRLSGRAGGTMRCHPPAGGKQKNEEASSLPSRTEVAPRAIRIPLVAAPESTVPVDPDHRGMVEVMATLATRQDAKRTSGRRFQARHEGGPEGIRTPDLTDANSRRGSAHVRFSPLW
jgi:hypothetical protein